MGAAVSARHVHLIPDFGAYSHGFDPLFSVRYAPHAFRGGDATLHPQARLLRKKHSRGLFFAMSLAVTVGPAIPER